MKRAFLLLLLTINCSFILSQTSCLQNLPDTIFHCGLTYNIPVLNGQGSWTVDCVDDEWISVSGPINQVFTFDFSACGVYKLYYAENSCGIDSVVLLIDDPSSTSYISQNDSDFGYSGVSCPSGGSSCDNTISIGGGEIPDPEWSICTELICSYEHINTTVIDSLNACWAVDIVFDTISGSGSTTMCWEGNQTAFLDFTDEDDITNNYFDFLDSLNGDLLNQGLCPLTSDFCSYGNCEPDSITYDTLQLPFPVHLGGQWHLIEGLDTIAMDSLTPFTKIGIDFLLQIEPSPYYVGPNNIDFTLFELNGIDTLPSSTEIELIVWWKELFTYDTIERIITNYHYPDTSICNGCGGFSYFSDYGAIPGIPAQPCGPITIGFGDECACGQNDFIVSGNLINCYDQCAEVFASGADIDIQSIVWSNGEVGPTAYVCDPGIIQAFALTNAGCEVESEFYVSIDDYVPEITIENSYSIGCNASCVDIIIPFMNELEPTFYLPNGEIIPGFEATVCEEGVVEIMAFNPFNGCDEFYTTFVELNNTEPFIDIAPSFILNCDPVLLEPQVTSNNLTYFWTGPLSNTDPEDPFVVADQPGVYSVTIFNEYGCSNIITTEVVQVESIETIIVPTISCDNNEKKWSIDVEVTNGGIGPFEYSLNGQDYQSESIFLDINPGMYDLYIRQSDGCIDLYPLDLEAEQIELPELQKDNDITCDNACVTLNIDLNDLMEDINSIKWILTDEIIENTTEIEVCEQGEYELIVEDLEGCEYIKNVTVESFLEAPQIIVNEIEVLHCDPLFLDVHVGNNTGELSYFWEGPGINTSNVNSANPEIELAGEYSVIVLNEYGCTSMESIVVNQVEPISAEFLTEKTCTDEFSGLIELYNVQGGIPPYEISINGEVFDNEELLIDQLSSGVYTLDIIDDIGCSTSYDIEIEAFPVINVEFEFEPVYDLCDNEYVQFDLRSLVERDENIESIIWNDGGTEVVKSLSQKGDYYFDVITTCSSIRHEFSIVDSRLDEEKLFYIPNIFTPNNDGVNDEFQIINLVPITDFSLEIYDRWGSKVFSSRNIEDKWLGKVLQRNGKQGVYTYAMKASINNCRDEEHVIYKLGDITVLK